MASPIYKALENAQFILWLGRGDLELFWETFPVYWSISEIYEMLAYVLTVAQPQCSTDAQGGLYFKAVFDSGSISIPLIRAWTDTFYMVTFPVNPYFMAAVLLKWEPLAGNSRLANLPGFHFVPLGLLCSNDSPGNSPRLTYYSFISYYGKVTG